MIQIFKCSYCEFIAGTSKEVTDHEYNCRSNPKFTRENELLQKLKDLEIEKQRVYREMNNLGCEKCDHFSRWSCWDDCGMECKGKDLIHLMKFGCDDFKEKE
jgi:hypothetical protein